MKDEEFGMKRTIGLWLGMAWVTVADVWVPGITEAVNDSIMSSPVIGIVGARRVEEGNVVTNGQVVIELDKRIEELEVSRRKLVRDLAKKEWDRVKSLSARSAISISQEEVDKKEAEYRVASVEHDLAEENLRRRLVIAPFDGLVAQIYLKVGEGCEVRQPVIRIVDTRLCYFVANVEAKLGQGLRDGQVVELEIEAGRTIEKFKAKISFVTPVADPASGLMRIKAQFENPERKIRPGVAGRMLLKEGADVQ